MGRSFRDGFRVPHPLVRSHRRRSLKITKPDSRSRTQSISSYHQPSPPWAVDVTVRISSVLNDNSFGSCPLKSNRARTRNSLPVVDMLRTRICRRSQQESLVTKRKTKKQQNRKITSMANTLICRSNKGESRRKDEAKRRLSYWFIARTNLWEE